MAEALAKHWLGGGAVIDSAGVAPEPLNAFAVAVMDEIGLDIRDHRTAAFADLADRRFDTVIALTESAHREAQAFAAGAAAVEFWPVADPTLNEGSREQRLTAFRMARADLEARIRRRFPRAPGAG